MLLSTPIEKIPNIGPIYQKRLKKLGIKTVLDFLFHFPHRYEDFSNIIKISEVKQNTPCCIQGKILDIQNSRAWKKRMALTQAIVSDKTGAIKIIWFNKPYLTQTLKPQDLVCLAGKPVIGDKGLYMSNPIYEKLFQATDYKISATNLTHTGRIIPVYPETEGLSSRWLRFIIKPLLAKLEINMPETLPEKIRKTHRLLPLRTALWQIHFPDSMQKAKKAKERFSFEELFFIGLLMLRERIKLTQKKAYQIALNLSLIQNFVASLPFKLTDAQKKSAWQILKDLEKPRPMNRLLEGDVGSGKTVVATMAALNTMKGGFQTAFMVPTEILAKQHFREIAHLLKDFNLNIGLLTGKEDKFISKKLKNDVVEVSRKKLLEKTAKGEINLLIGTHALIQDKVKFGKLALVILDEQHRFGVEQRAKLCQDKKGQTKLIPHLLSMTATPIPRTLALTLYGDLDLSLITELPKGRKKIITKVTLPPEREKVYRFIKKEVKKGRQVFVICPRIEPTNTVQDNGFNQTDYTKSYGELSWAEVKTVKAEYEKLSKNIFPDLKVRMLYGKMTPKEKEKIMKDMKNKKIDILVSTSVIEVGIDIPNATIMMIEGAERFGLAQLHQFRGRVGRSKFQSFCFLLTDSTAKKTQQRLKALLDSEDGFKLAEKDLEIRGPGNFSGTRQWGIPDLIMSSLKDIFLVEKTRLAAQKILEEDPGLKKYPILRARLERYRRKIHLE
ncbi:ATP-dependent DNA helicase RecG [Patescibacteria group bacterium]|nr:ATP-dependent DNA helicase RecG [Patescibacteria group bacterium]